MPFASIRKGARRNHGESAEGWATGWLQMAIWIQAWTLRGGFVDARQKHRRQQS